MEAEKTEGRPAGMMYWMMAIAAVMAVLCAAQAVRESRQGKGGTRVFWSLLSVAFAACLVLSIVRVVSHFS